MKKVNVTVRRLFEMSYDIPVTDEEYETLIGYDSDDVNIHDAVNVETDVTAMAFEKFRETIVDYLYGQQMDWSKFHYDSDYQIATEDGEVIVSFDEE